MPADIQQAFQQALRDNDVETARRMLAAGADVNAPLSAEDEYYNYPIFHAIEDIHLEMLQLLIEAGADVNVRDKGNSTPLMECNLACAEVVRMLLEAGAEVNPVRDEENYTPLLYAARSGSPESVKLLLEAGAHVNVHGGNSCETPYELARFEANYMENEDAPEILALLLAAGALPGVMLDIEDYPAISPADYDFLHAVQHQDIAGIEKALHGGASIDATDRYGASAIEQAVLYNNEQMCQLLVSKGISQKFISEACWQLYAPLAYNNTQLMQYLLAQLEGEMLTRAKEIALSYAASTGCLQAAKILLDTGANPNLHNARQETPLMAATHAPANKEEMLNLLLDHGADINAANKYGTTALQLALGYRETSVIKLLLRRGADITAQNDRVESLSALARACPDIAKALEETAKPEQK